MRKQSRANPLTALLVVKELPKDFIPNDKVLMASFLALSTGPSGHTGYAEPFALFSLSCLQQCCCQSGMLASILTTGATGFLNTTISLLSEFGQTLSLDTCI